jgi:hypothetical protein
MINDPNNKESENQEEMPKHSLIDSVNAVVDFMNSGKADPNLVYPKDQYHGD